MLQAGKPNRVLFARLLLLVISACSAHNKKEEKKEKKKSVRISHLDLALRRTSTRVELEIIAGTSWALKLAFELVGDGTSHFKFTTIGRGDFFFLPNDQFWTTCDDIKRATVVILDAFRSRSKQTPCRRLDTATMQEGSGQGKEQESS
ncbi:hypothetical protein B0H19DRAFT_242565 [Mycena capillaripes]|nr:hypothetical protein B0H19DRAFT_242565 [Mycena capillaripes]